ncbi:MAG TPA: transketolase [bacterium]|nr:transketolase [bacterium]
MNKEIKKLTKIAQNIRIDIIKMLHKAGSGHTAGSLGMTDIFVSLYFNILNHKPKLPTWPHRDRVVLSNGHICPALYATLAHSGYFPCKKLMTLRQLGSPLQGHPHRLSLPGIENTSGPLGQGLSQACGIALAAKLNHQNHRIYCLTSDGEHNEGQTWEAIMFASKYKLNNLTQIIDRNNIQIDGHTENVMSLEPLREKYKAFNWHVIDIDGHNFQNIIDACNLSKTIYEKPTLIIAHTIPGKGVDFMENNPSWHGRSPNPTETKLAIKQISVS